ncbi:MAG TPA: SDR family oxidoreductase [Kaistia sp.]|nr:SDR family oxidoreductase [Kaistia sp.]
MRENWTAQDMPSQHGKTIVVTGTGGLGFEDGLALARAGGDVIIAGRNPRKGNDAVARIKQAVQYEHVSFEPVDLADIVSVSAFGQRLRDSQQKVDILINNAAVMAPPQRQTTVDGFELQFGTNYLGHFALTAHLLPLLSRGQDPRVVTLSSIAVRRNTAIDFDDLQAEKAYHPMVVYAQSKLACLIFALELQRRSDAAGWGLTSIAAHPGIARTDLLHNAPGRHSAQGLLRSLLWFLFQPAAQGALPALFAATSPDARGGGYYGPNRLSETRGYPSEAAVPAPALELHVASRLWEVSEKLANVDFDAAAKAPLQTGPDLSSASIDFTGI